MFARWLLIIALADIHPVAAAEGALMTARDLAPLAAAPAGERIAYGADPLQFGELTLPAGPGPFPVLVWLHGGCWLAAFDIAHSRALAQSFAANGIAVWNLEYRRVGDPGGGWPGTFLDVADGTDHLRSLLEHYPLDGQRILFGGHSAGGHLALWLAGRATLPEQSLLYRDRPLQPHGILALAPAVDLAALHAQETCDSAATRLLGGGPDEYPQRYSDAAVEPRIPLSMPQAIVVGEQDATWTWLGEAYADRALDAGSTALQLITLPASGHFEMIAPASSSWPRVVEATRWLLQRIDASTPAAKR
jgi:acetyl esterase/lipase